MLKRQCVAALIQALAAMKGMSLLAEPGREVSSMRAL
jgi:hypothetical protein